MSTGLPGSFPALISEARTSPATVSLQQPQRSSHRHTPNRVLLWLLCVLVGTPWVAGASWWDADVEAVLNRAEERRDVWKEFLESTDEDLRSGAAFLLKNMPQRDLADLPADWLAENLALAYEARKESKWGPSIPEEIFLNDVLPYVNIDETRENWRGKLREIALPLVAEARTASAAAMALNEKLFPLVEVRYSTQRRKANQSAFESMESGLASCTGLSILLVNACRSIGVPARLVGIPSWVDKRGNHTWVEIWDGDWHFLGAAEPDPLGLNRGWFVHDASLAIKDSRQHAIYAVSYAATDVPFPMVWARGRDSGNTVSAVNVTDRYTGRSRGVGEDETRLLVQVYQRRGADRLEVPIVVASLDNDAVLEGYSKDESADTNDILEFRVRREGRYRVSTEYQGRTVSQETGPFDGAQHRVMLFVEDVQLAGLLPPVCYFPPKPTRPLPETVETIARKQLQDYFAAEASARENWAFPDALDEALKTYEPELRRLTWELYREHVDHSKARENFEMNQVQFENHLSPYVVREVGDKPPGGWPLFIAMHGGGNTRQEVNDRQWRVMQRYYNDHPELGGYLYLALRAPNNTWNGFYDTYVYPLIAQLIQQFLLFGEVNSNKVFLMGYSHGGYGAFAIGPKIPHRFAAIHASAAAPTDGETTADTLRNTIFTYMIGENDTAYGRIERNRAFDQQVKSLRGSRVDIYPVLMEYREGMGHGGLPDKDKIADMLPALRNPVPRELTWTLTDSVVRDFFWLHTADPGKEQKVDVSCRENRLQVKSENMKSLKVRLDSRLVSWDKPLRISVDGLEYSRDIAPRMSTLVETLIESGDPELAFTVDLDLSKLLATPDSQPQANATGQP